MRAYVSSRRRAPRRARPGHDARGGERTLGRRGRLGASASTAARAARSELRPAPPPRGADQTRGCSGSQPLAGSATGRFGRKRGGDEARVPRRERRRNAKLPDGICCARARGDERRCLSADVAAGSRRPACARPGRRQRARKARRRSRWSSCCQTNSSRFRPARTVSAWRSRAGAKSIARVGHDATGGESVPCSRIRLNTVVK